MTLGERPLDRRLAPEQPVHRGEQLDLLDLAEPELVGQRRFGEAARRRQLGPRPDQPLDDHRDDEVARATALATDQPLKVQLAQHAEHRGDMAVRQTSARSQAPRRRR